MEAHKTGYDKKLEKYKWEIRHFYTFFKQLRKSTPRFVNKVVESQTFIPSRKGCMNFLKLCSDKQVTNSKHNERVAL